MQVGRGEAGVGPGQSGRALQAKGAAWLNPEGSQKLQRLLQLLSLGVLARARLEPRDSPGWSGHLRSVTGVPELE